MWNSCTSFSTSLCPLCYLIPRHLLSAWFATKIKKKMRCCVQFALVSLLFCDSVPVRESCDESTNWKRNRKHVLVNRRFQNRRFLGIYFFIFLLVIKYENVVLSSHPAELLTSGWFSNHYLLANPLSSLSINFSLSTSFFFNKPRALNLVLKGNICAPASLKERTS